MLSPFPVSPPQSPHPMSPPLCFSTHSPTPTSLVQHPTLGHQASTGPRASLPISQSPPPPHNPSPIPTSHSPMSCWVSPGYPHTPAFQVSVRLGASSPTEARQGSPPRRTYPTYRQQLWNSLLQLFETHMKTKLHICYIYVSRPRSSLCMFFGWWFTL